MCSFITAQVPVFHFDSNACLRLVCGLLMGFTCTSLFAKLCAFVDTIFPPDENTVRTPTKTTRVRESKSVAFHMEKMKIFSHKLVLGALWHPFDDFFHGLSH